jgi:hypothetical protein
MSTKKEVNGIILILSCQKHKDTRLKEINLKNTSYANWEVVHVIGDFFCPRITSMKITKLHMAKIIYTYDAKIHIYTCLKN